MNAQRERKEGLPMTARLWDETDIKSMHLKNRFWRGAIYQDLPTLDGHMTEEYAAIYERVAQGGVSTILTGYARVLENDQPNPRLLGIYDDGFIDEYRAFTDRIHAHDCNIILQIVYGGARTTVPADDRIIWGASAVENERSRITPTPMTHDDIETLITAFADAGARAQASGFDGVQIHAAHGYMFSSFLSPHYNRRTDEYGGSIENRGRIIEETLIAVRERVGENFPIFIKFNSQDCMADGLTEEDSIALIRHLERHGLDGAEISGGNECFPAVAAAGLGPSRTGLARHKERDSYFAGYARKLAAQTSLPLILTGGNRHFDVMQKLLEEGAADYFGLARPLLSEPDLIRRWRVDESYEPRCLACNKCFTTPGHRCILEIKSGGEGGI